MSTKTREVSLPHSEALLAQFAEGWLLLGNPSEANEELEKINLAFRFHPQVLSLRWRVYAQAGLWEAAWVISKVLCQLLPEQPEVWICQANSLRHYKGVGAAWKLLSSVAGRFPNQPKIQYNLARYACQLGKLKESSRLLLQTFETGDNLIKLTALADPDLKPLWERIGAGPLIGFYLRL